MKGNSVKHLSQVLLVVITVLLFIGLFAGKKLFQTLGKTENDYKYLSLFAEVTALVKNDYVEAIKPADSFEGAFSAMLRELDQCSAYLDPQRSRLYDLYQTGSIYGLGIFGVKRQNYFYISDILKNSPAESEKLLPGDMIKSTNGNSIFSLSFWEMNLSLYSNQPENMDLTVYRKNSKKPEQIRLKTQLLNFDPIFKKIRDKIYLIKLFRIDTESVNFLREKLQQEFISTLIIDLRKYAGGDYNSFVEICKLLLPEDNHLTLTTRDGEMILRLGSLHSLSGRTMAIIGPSTIMYSELLAASLKANGATLVGTGTPGFISQLRKIDLEDGSSLLITEGTFNIDGQPLGDTTGVLPTVETEETNDDRLMARCISLLSSEME